jgi:hypothetical protein
MIRVEVTGLRQLINALDQIDKNAVKHIRKEITSAAKVVVASAQGSVSDQPLSGWGTWGGKSGRDLGFDPGMVSKGIRIKSNRFRRGGVNRGFGYDVVNSNAAGAILEVIGDKSRVSSDKGAQFVDSITARYGMTRPRILMPAYYAGMTPEVRERIRDAILDEARKAGIV